MSKRGRPRRMGKVAGMLAVATLASGCSISPSRFRDTIDPAPLVRARATGLGDDLPDEVVLPALIDRLDDPDPVVRLAAIEELRTRTGHDFGFKAWQGDVERGVAVNRWRSWWAGRQAARVSESQPVTPATP